MACETTYTPRMRWGRMQLMAMPRVWVLENIERVAAEGLAPFDYWNYRRLLELYSMLDPDLVSRLVDRGLSSTDFEVREAAEDFRDPDYALAVGHRVREAIARMYPQAVKSRAVRRKSSDDSG